MKGRRFVVIGFLSFFSMWLWAAGTSDFSAQLIEDIQYSTNKQGQATIEIRFSVPVRYTRREIKDRASRAEARVEFALTEIQKRRLPLEEVRVAEKNDFVPLRSVTYDGFNINDPLISIRFDRKVLFNIKQGGIDSIKITLPEISPKEEPINLISAEQAARIQEQLKKLRKRQKQAQAAQKAVPKKSAPIKIAKAATPPPALPPINLPPKMAVKKNKGKMPNDKSMGKLIAQGRAALTRGDNRAAVKLFTHILNTKNHSFHADAQELLGLARERNGQTAHALRLYQHYLKLFPEGEGFARVKQRLADLQGTQVVQSGSLKKSKRFSDKGFRKDVFGSLSLWSFTGESTSTPVVKPAIGNGSSTSKLETQQSFLNMNGRFRSPRFDIRTSAYGTFTRDSNNPDEPAETEIVANNFYMDIKDSKLGYSARLGRQSGNSGGIFGRFDGALLGYDFSKQFRINGAYGYTVDFSEKGKIQTDQPFIATSLGLGTFYKYLDVSPYFFTQTLEGITNRTAVGMESRWGHPKWNLFNLIDYELEYGQVNIVMLNALYRLSKNTTININADDRKSPILQTRNALNDGANLAIKCAPIKPVNGVPVLLPVISIKDALSRGDCDENDLRDFASQFTGKSTFFTVSVNHNLSQRVQFNFDVSQIKTTLSSLIPVEEDPGRFDEIIEDSDQIALSAQLVISQLFQQRDTNIFGIRLTQDKNYDSFGFNISNRLNYGRSIRFSTRLNGDFRTNKQFTTIGGQQLRLRPSLKLDYRWKRSFEIQTEISYDSVKNSGDLNNLQKILPGEDPDDPNALRVNDNRSNSTNYLFTVGFRQDF